MGCESSLAARDQSLAGVVRGLSREKEKKKACPRGAEKGAYASVEKKIICSFTIL
jgi:hypothetical protein